MPVEGDFKLVFYKQPPKTVKAGGEIVTNRGEKFTYCWNHTVRGPPRAWTILQHDGPDHLGFW